MANMRLWDFYYCAANGSDGPNYEVRLYDETTGDFISTLDQFSTPLSTAKSGTARAAVRAFLENELIPLLETDVSQTVTLEPEQ